MPLMLDPPIYESATDAELRAWLATLQEMRAEIPLSDTRAHAALDRSERETRAELQRVSYRGTEAQRRTYLCASVPLCEAKESSD